MQKHWGSCRGRELVQPRPCAALCTRNCRGWKRGLPGEHSDVPLLGQGFSQLCFGGGGGSDAFQQAVGWLEMLEEHQDDFILEICPCGALSVPQPSWPTAGQATGTCSAHNCACPVSYRSAGKRVGENVSQTRVRCRSLWHA